VSELQWILLVALSTWSFFVSDSWLRRQLGNGKQKENQNGKKERGLFSHDGERKLKKNFINGRVRVAGLKDGNRDRDGGD
jgi:hypothetical protein